MGRFNFLNKVLCIALSVMVVVGLVDSSDSRPMTLFVHFLEAPNTYSRVSTAVFIYSVKRPDGSSACINDECSFYCELDGESLRWCPKETITVKKLAVNRKHTFLVNVTTPEGDRNSSSYSWFVDTIPPTATLHSKQNYTNGQEVSIEITFSEACNGFKCVNSSHCDVMLNGPGLINTSSLRVITPDMTYKLDVILSPKLLHGRVVVGMADNICTDKAGNSFKITITSVIILRFDRRAVVVDLWMPVPSYVMKINQIPRTVVATNRMDDLNIFLDFNIPIRNTSQQLLNVLHVNSGKISPVLRTNHGNRKFVFQLKNVSNTEIITVELATGSLIGMTGNIVSPVDPLTVLYDSTELGVGLSTSSPSMTDAPEVNVIVEFTKPVFGFEDDMVQVKGGKLTRFKQLSRALYSLTLRASHQHILSVAILEGKVNDISGNLNSGSNELQVSHYSTPATSTALHSFVTVGVISTSLAAVALSLSSANLKAIGALPPGTTNPSTNLHGLFGHLQVFVLSDWLIMNLPIEYSETTKGLRWLIPRQKLPWKEDVSSIWPNHIHLPRVNKKSSINLVNYSWGHGHGNVSRKSTRYGLPLNSREYFIYFLRGEPLSATNVVKRMENYNGWRDLQMNMFWLGIGGGGSLVIHVLILLFLKWRTRTPAHGILSVPRFEVLLLILALPCISQSAAFVIRGGTGGGIITGTLLLVIPAALVLSICIFLIVVVFSGNFAQYKEIRHVALGESWCKKLESFFIGRPSMGKWFYKEGLPSSFVQRFGILFEDRKGPPVYIFVEQDDSNTIPNWTESGTSGIGRMRAMSSDESNEETKVPVLSRHVGFARSSYVILDILRRVSLGFIAGVCLLQKPSQGLFALGITLVQLGYSVALKPYINRGVHIVESISLVCEVGIFGLSIAVKSWNPLRASTTGYIMLALLLTTFISHVVLEWYVIIKGILELSRPEKNSLRRGLKFAAKGLVLPFLKRKHWSPQPKIETERRDARAPRIDSFGAMTATVVPVQSPGPHVVGDRKEVELEQKSELKKLRELAKASFLGESQRLGLGLEANFTTG